jgi:hypothetical protein
MVAREDVLMTSSRSGPLAAWASSWLAGHAAADEVLRAVVARDGPHRVAGLPQQPVSAPLSELLIAWRRDADRVRLVLPVPGDLRGLPDQSELRAAALAAGEAVVGSGIALVPAVFDPTPSSAPISVTWQAYEVSPAAPDHVPLADAQYELATAIRETAAALVQAGVTGTPADISESLGQARRRGEHVNLPPDHPPRAVVLVAQAERLQAVLELAMADPVGAAVTAYAVQARDEALRPLATAVRRALLAGYNARPADQAPETIASVDQH